MSINQNNQPSEPENKPDKSTDRKNQGEQKPSMQKPEKTITHFDLNKLDTSDYSEKP